MLNFECAMLLTETLPRPLALSVAHNSCRSHFLNSRSSKQQSLKRSAPGEDNGGGAGGGASVSLVANAANADDGAGPVQQFRQHQAASKRPRKSMGRRVSFAPDAVLETRHMYALVST